MPGKRKTQKTAKPPSLSTHGHALCAIGKETSRVVTANLDLPGLGTVTRLDSSNGGSYFSELAEGFKTAKWSDDQAAKVLEAALARMRDGSNLDRQGLKRWVKFHPNDFRAVIECLNVVPPEEIELVRVLSRVGNQKIVFLASWRWGIKRDVVLKTVTGPNRERILRRESQIHPLTTKHPNIVETYILKNKFGDAFLIEKYLDQVLHDGWRSGGIQEAANLLYDIASALNYLHSELNGVHADIKPDNIAKDSSRYVLLDFGMYRSKEDFTPGTTATGSLRTQAPDLLELDQYDYPEKSDIWALGATVFNAIVGRFPLFDAGETPPSPRNPSERKEFEKVLRERVRTEYDKRVTFDRIPTAIRSVLSCALERDPEKRHTAARLIEKAERSLRHS